VSEPASLVAEAVRDAGLVVKSLVVTDYDPDAFGNLVANVETDAGPLVIVYDRGFFVDWATAPTDEALHARLLEALEHRRKMSFGGPADSA
jgi:hypothetical protein